MLRLAFIILVGAVFFSAGAAAQDRTGAKQTAIEAFNAEQYATARHAFASLANAGDAEAQFFLGIMLLRGLGAAAAPAHGVQWLERAANQGHSAAQYHLGDIYRTGTGVAADSRKAAYWYERAAQQGWFGAQMALARIYTQGDGVQRDPIAAHKWYDIAAEMGLDPYNGARDALAATMTDTEIAEARRQAKAWLSAHRRWNDTAIEATAEMSGGLAKPDIR